MANVKKQTKKKNTAKSKTDEQTAKSVSQTSIHPYKKRIIFFSILSLTSLTLAITSNEPIFCWVLTFFFAWMATLMLILGSLFPNFNPNTKTDTQYKNQSFQIKNGTMMDQAGIGFSHIHDRH